MKRIALFCSALVLTLLTLQAQIRGNEIRVVVSPDHTDWTYQPKEKCSFRIQVYKAQNLLPGAVIDYELGPEMYPTEKKQGVVLKNGELTVKSSLKQPGFIRCKVRAHVNGRTYEGIAAAGYAPEKIQAKVKNPQDFDEFWKKTLEEARRTPLKPTMELIPERCTETVNVYHVSFHNIRWGSRTYGILCMPKAPGKYPALLRVPGAGIRPYYGDIQTAEKGAITLEIGVHGIPVNLTQDFYDRLYSGALANYWQANADNRDEFYYKRVFVGAVRAVDFICSLPQYNGKALGVTGSSQGGALSFSTAALHPSVTCLAAVHPAMCDHEAFIYGQAGGWPHYFYYQKPDADRLEVSRYYDSVNFARLIQVPGWYSWGWNDEVCPPTSMHAAYNSLTAPKELHPYLETGHFWYQEQYDAWNQWLWKQMGLE